MIPSLRARFIWTYLADVVTYFWPTKGSWQTAKMAWKKWRKLRLPEASLLLLPETFAKGEQLRWSLLDLASWYGGPLIWRCGLAMLLAKQITRVCHAMPMPMPCPFAQEPRLRNTLPVSGTPAEANAMVIGYDTVGYCSVSPGNQGIWVSRTPSMLMKSRLLQITWPKIERMSCEMSHLLPFHFVTLLYFAVIPFTDTVRICQGYEGSFARTNLRFCFRAQEPFPQGPKDPKPKFDSEGGFPMSAELP